jgi:fido (protein-threonine AMPylation protein)
VAHAEAALYSGAWADHPLDESLLLDLHARICGDLVPDWAGRWRAVEVRVGRLEPPAPHRIAEEMRHYAADLAPAGRRRRTRSRTSRWNFSRLPRGVS